MESEKKTPSALYTVAQGVPPTNPIGTGGGNKPTGIDLSAKLAKEEEAAAAAAAASEGVIKAELKAVLHKLIQ